MGEKEKLRQIKMKLFPGMNGAERSTRKIGCLDLGVGVGDGVGRGEERSGKEGGGVGGRFGHQLPAEKFGSEANSTV